MTQCWWNGDRQEKLEAGTFGVPSTVHLEPSERLTVISAQPARSGLHHHVRTSIEWRSSSKICYIGRNKKPTGRTTF